MDVEEVETEVVDAVVVAIKEVALMRGPSYAPIDLNWIFECLSI